MTIRRTGRDGGLKRVALPCAIAAALALALPASALAKTYVADITDTASTDDYVQLTTQKVGKKKYVTGFGAHALPATCDEGTSGTLDLTATGAAKIKKHGKFRFNFVRTNREATWQGKVHSKSAKGTVQFDGRIDVGGGQSATCHTGVLNFKT